MHNKVVHRIARGLRRAGSAVLRFNYRGVNLSEGAYAHGKASLMTRGRRFSIYAGDTPGYLYSLAGFSFGSRVILRLGCGERPGGGAPGARRLIAAGFPTVYQDHGYLEDCHVPRVFIQSRHDQFGPLPEFEAFVKTLPEPKQVILIEAQTTSLRVR